MILKTLLQMLMYAITIEKIIIKSKYKNDNDYLMQNDIQCIFEQKSKFIR